MAWWEKLKLTTVAQWISVALLLAGIVMVAIAAATGNILLLIAGAIVLGLGIVASVNEGRLQDWVETLGLEKVMGYVTAAVLLVAFGLIAIGLMTVNPAMFIGGGYIAIAGLIVGERVERFKAGLKPRILKKWLDGFPPRCCLPESLSFLSAQ